MAINFRSLVLAFQAYRDSDLGNFALLKADAVGAKANSAIVDKMEKVRGYYPSIDSYPGRTSMR